MLALVLALSPLPATAVSDSGASYYIVDPLTGVALNGYDPVSYFTGDTPVVGRPEFELVWGGVSWYFANGANRDIFIRAPEVYAPQFGGHGTMGLARGYLSDGNPLIYTLIGNRLFLFYSTANRDAFMLSQRSSYEQALRNWDFLSVDLINRDINGPLWDEVQVGPVVEPMEGADTPPAEGEPDMAAEPPAGDAAAGAEAAPEAEGGDHGAETPEAAPESGH